MSSDLSRQVAGRILSLKGHGEDDKAFAERVGLTPQLVSNYATGTNGAGLAAIAKVVARVPDLSANWLLTGSRPIYLREPSVAEAAAIEEAAGMAVQLRVVGKVVEGDFVGAIEDLTDATVGDLESVESLAGEARAFLAALRKLASEEATP